MYIIFFDNNNEKDQINESEVLNRPSIIATVNLDKYLINFDFTFSKFSDIISVPNEIKDKICTLKKFSFVSSNDLYITLFNTPLHLFPIDIQTGEEIIISNKFVKMGENVTIYIKDCSYNSEIIDKKQLTIRYKTINFFNIIDYMISTVPNIINYFGYILESDDKLEIIKNQNMIEFIIEPNLIEKYILSLPEKKIENLILDNFKSFDFIQTNLVLNNWDKFINIMQLQLSNDQIHSILYLQTRFSKNQIINIQEKRYIVDIKKTYDFYELNKQNIIPRIIHLDIETFTLTEIQKQKLKDAFILYKNQDFNKLSNKKNVGGYLNLPPYDNMLLKSLHYNNEVYNLSLIFPSGEEIIKNSIISQNDKILLKVNNKFDDDMLPLYVFGSNPHIILEKS